jgi:hypothetical protein
MSKTGKLLLCVLGLAVLTTPLLAQDAVSAQKRAQGKALALRAARADAMRKLGERINGLSITSETKVRDFVTESDKIQSAMRTFLLGMREVGSPEYSEDGVCVVRMEVTLEEVIRALRKIHSDYAKAGGKTKDYDFTKMTVTNKETIIRVVGQGAPRPEPEYVEDELVEPDEFGIVSWAKFGKTVQDFWKTNCTGRGRLMAERAARLDAMRRLVERIKGVNVDSQTLVKDFVAESDDINVSFENTFLRGAREIGVRYHSDDLIVEVEMQVKLKQVFAAVHSWAKVHYKGDQMKLRELEQRTVKTEMKIIKETGVGVPPERYLVKAPPVVQAVAAMARKSPDWVGRTERAVGQGAIDPDNDNKAQAKLMALRAAEMDGRRKLAERIEGLMLTSNTSVRDFVAESDEIQSSMMTFQAGAYVVDGSQKVSDDGVAEVTVEIELKPLWNSVLFYKKKLNLGIE